MIDWMLQYSSSQGAGKDSGIFVAMVDWMSIVPYRNEIIIAIFSIVILTYVIISKDKTIELKDKTIELKDEIARRERAKRLLLTEVNLSDISTLIVQIPPSVQIDTATYNAARAITAAFSHYGAGITEGNGSINTANSIHAFMRDLIVCIRGKFPSTTIRVVYEWSILRVINEKFGKIDFTFIPTAVSHASWFNYRGGIEMKRNDPSKQSDRRLSGGPMDTCGRAQAFERAKECVFARWSALGESGEHRSFCCFSDSKRFGIARVSIDSGHEVTFEASTPVFFPGANDAAIDDEALRMLAHVLSSSEQDLDYLISPFRAPSPNVHGTVNGQAQTWILGRQLGAGGYSIVYEDAGDAEGCVIKCLQRKTKDKNKLQVENDALLAISAAYATRLAANQYQASPSTSAVIGLLVGHPQGFPFRIAPIGVDHAAVSVSTPVALKLSPRGLQISEYLRVIALMPGVDLSNTLTTLIQLLGCAMVITLDIAHNQAKYVHGDIRPDNLLIVPSIAKMAEIRDCQNDVGNAINLNNAVTSIDLNSCTFLLNDWGEATSMKTRTNDAKKRKDLKDLVEALCVLHNVPDLSLSSISLVKENPIHRKPADGSSLSAAQMKAYLLQLADGLKYQKLRDTISQVQIEAV